MVSYKAPLRDMRFALYEMHDVEGLTKYPGYAEMGRDLLDPVLDECAKFCEEVLFPLNRSADEEGCHFENGVVRAPKGFIDAYNLYREGGWGGFASPPEWGGQGLPHVIGTLIEEMQCSSNLSFNLYGGLTQGAIRAILSHASQELKEKYVPAMVEGKWTGTMCLTEPHCGTDLGQIRTRAVPVGDGTYKITGTKIFITGGEHDLTENIIHLVLAKLPDAPKGVKGISLFLVPKVMVKDDGKLGPRNGVACGAVEHKMGIKGSATCVMNFDDATGWLVGEPHKGMRAMFTMMNAARIGVGIQGIGLGEVSYQGATAYARERLQGRSLSGAKYPDKVADPIIVHPDVRRMLLTMRATTEGTRSLAIWVSRALDVLTHSEDPKEKQDAEDFVALMTPIVKALSTDLGFEATNIGMQVLGGHGFIRENGMEQYVRDARIAQLYEGTNGIQALDLVGRKLPAHAGRFLRHFFHPVQAYIEAKVEDEALGPFVQPLAKAFVRLQQATAHIAQKGMANPEEAGAAATEYLRLFGLVALAFMWCKAAEVALPKAGTGEDGDGFYKAKVNTARFYVERILPQTSGLFAGIMAGGKTMMAFDDAAF
jgi:butyryl-CoA dehydrogenase